MSKILAYLEIEKHSNIKYEYDKKFNKLMVDRVIPYPYFYPYSYGYIPNTLGKDNDELDILLITNEKYKNDILIECHIIGGLVMEDEKGMDEKILVVPCNEYELVNDMSSLSQNVLDDIHWFFSNYKSKTPNKWSKVYNFISKEEAIKLYQESICTGQE